MVRRDEENLKELFEQFLSADEAVKAAEDVYKAEQILRKYPSPEPKKELIDSIKTDIAFSLLNKQAHVFRKAAYRVMAIAAAIIIVAAIGLNIFMKNNVTITPPKKLVSAAIIPTAIWESDNIAVDDHSLATFTAEADQIENELVALQSGKSESNFDEAVTELEMDLMEIQSDFWKG
jgi:anti-sigma-K factor RskA